MTFTLKSDERTRTGGFNARRSQRRPPALQSQGATQKDWERKYREVVGDSHEVVFETDEAGCWTLLNPAWTELTGFPIGDSLGRLHLYFVHPDDLDPVRMRLESLLRGGGPLVREEYRLITRDGGYRWVEMAARRASEAGDGGTAIRGSITDIHHRKLAQRLESDRTQVLEMVARNRPLPEILKRLVQLVERQRPGVAASVVLQRQGRCFHAAAPNLSPLFTQAVDQEAGDHPADFFTQAVFGGQKLVAQDIASDPGWKLHRDLAREHGLRACWAVPLQTGEDAPLGSFVVYSHTPRPPAVVDQELAATAAQLASIAIEQRQMADQLAFQAHHDALTGLPNRLLLEDRLQQTLEEARRHSHLVAVHFIDLDRFKEINDTLGHAIGDHLLRGMAQRLKSCGRAVDTVARMGGDEFIIVQSELKDAQDAYHFARHIQEILTPPFQIEGHELQVAASIGISIFPQDGQDAATLKRNADIAMYKAKVAGRGNIQNFTQEMFEARRQERSIEQELRKSKFELFYQPQVDLDGRISGLEALLRLNHPQHGMMLPEQFISIAEDTGLILGIGDWVLRHVCRQIRAWKDAGLHLFPIAVNISARHFAQPDFVRQIAALLQQNGIEGRCLELELTESCLVSNTQDVAATLRQLKQLDIRVGIDDFGMGYSSLAHLQQLPIDRLKINHLFIQDLCSRKGQAHRAQALVKTIICMARCLEMEVLAEGVETPAQAEFLKLAGCDRAQGLFFHQPMTPAEVQTCLTSKS